MADVYVCQGCGDVTVPSAPHLTPLQHYVKDANGVTGRWCGGYELKEITADD